MKKIIALSLVSLVSLLVILLFVCKSDDTITCSNCSEPLPKSSLFCSKCGNAVSNTQSDAEKPKEITREELIAKLGGVLNASCDEMVKYHNLLQNSKYYIEGEIKKAEYDTFFKTYEYKLDAGLFNTVTIRSAKKILEGEYVYVTVTGLITSHDVGDNISRNKTNEAYLSAEDYFEICKANEKTRFKVTGYVLDSHTDIFGSTTYYMYQSEADYTGDKYRDNWMLIEFSDEQTNIIGKKIQVMGNLWRDGLHNCSLVSD